MRVVAAGEALLAPSVTRRLIAEFARRPRADRPRPTALERAHPAGDRGAAADRAGPVEPGDRRAIWCVAEQTVKTHVSRILGKLGLRDRAQAASSRTRQVWYARLVTGCATPSAAALGGVADLAHKLLEGVFQHDDADGMASGIKDLAEISAGGLHFPQRGPQRLIGLEHRQRPDEAGIEGSGARSGADVEDVLDVDVAVEGRSPADREPGVPGARGQLLDVGDGGVRRNGDDGIDRQDNAVHAAFLEGQCLAEQVVLLRLQQAFPARLGDQPRHLLPVEGAGHLVPGLDPQRRRPSSRAR